VEVVWVVQSVQHMAVDVKGEIIKNGVQCAAVGKWYHVLNQVTSVFTKSTSHQHYLSPCWSQFHQFLHSGLTIMPYPHYIIIKSYPHYASDQLGNYIRIHEETVLHTAAACLIICRLSHKSQASTNHHLFNDCSTIARLSEDHQAPSVWLKTPHCQLQEPL